MRSLNPSLVILGCIAVLLLQGAPTDACTSFLLKHADGPFMAKNYDWKVANGLVLINARGLAKTALLPDGSKPVRWTSRYGSVSFNQYGREFPMGGMNETGLAMEVLWLDETVYPEPGDRKAIGALQWIQYCLDSFRTVSDVVASASELSIGSPAKLHFLACDPTGNCAVIEFLDGQLVARSERTLPLAVLTNDTYNSSLEYLNRTLGYGGEPVTPEGTGSLARYARTADGARTARAARSETPVLDAFAILADVAQPGLTQWSIVYELQEGRIHFRSSANAETRSIVLAELDLDCTAEPLSLDLRAEGSGDVTAELKPYSGEANLETIRAGFSTDRLTTPSDEFIQLMAAYPNKLLCTFDAAE